MTRDRGGPGNPRVRVFETSSEAPRRAAGLLAAALRGRVEPVLVLASGKTTVPIYRALVRLHRLGRAPFDTTRTFNLDELVVPAGDPRSFRSFMDRHLFRRVDLETSRIHFLRGGARDRKSECARYEAELAKFGAPDVALVGIGSNGHVAYLEPGPWLPPRTAPVLLSPQTRRSLAADGMKPAPRRALTMGIESILSARSIVLVATGRSKAEAVACALEGPVSPACPASFLSLHSDLTVLLDRASARLLRKR